MQKTSNVMSSSVAQLPKGEYKTDQKTYSTKGEKDTSGDVGELTESRTAYCSAMTPCNVTLEIDFSKLQRQRLAYQLNAKMK